MREGAGFTPFTFGAIRVLIAGTILIIWGALVRRRLRPTREELITLIGSGLFLWLGGNGMVMLAEQRADSGLAALVIASTPIWASTLEAVFDRKAPSPLHIGALLVGSLGIVVLSMPMILSGLRGDLLSVVALLLAALSWAAGSVFQGRRKSSLAPEVSSAYQLLFGGVGFALTALLLREPAPQPIAEAWWALGYLVVFGSVLAFTSYVKVLRLLPMRIVVTYSYVNPIIAVMLGWIILGERITLWTVGGAVLVLLGVAGVFRSHTQDRKAIEQVKPAGSLESTANPRAES
jgi:drug/metabolite transporter (DMT)-like permease